MARPACALREAARLLATATERARAGAGRLVLLRGATGTGRTTVLEAAAEDGMRVLRARCYVGDAAVPFAAILQLLGPLAVFADLPLDGDERVIGAGLWRTLRSYAEESPLLITVDDVHLADPASRRWLVETVRLIDRLPIVLVATERSQYDVDPPAPGLAHSLSPALVTTHTLTPLSDDSAVAAVRSAFPDADNSWIADCVRAGAGNPLLLRALLDDLSDGSHPVVPDTSAALYPGAFPAAVQWWLDCAGPGTAEVARTLAILDEGWNHKPAPGTEGHSAVHIPSLLAELSDADPARVTGWITAMTCLGLLRTDDMGRARYAHPLLRDAVLTGVPAARRRAAHRTTAEMMLHHGASSDLVARQLLLIDAVNAPWALPVLQDAASLALHEGQIEDAVAFLRRALNEPLSDEVRQRLLTELGSLEYAVPGSSAAILRLTEALRLPGPPQERVRAAVALGTALTGRGRTRAAVEVLRSLYDGLADRPDLVRILRQACLQLSDKDQAVRQEAYERLADVAEHSPVSISAAGHAFLVKYSVTAGLRSAKDAMLRLRGLLAEPTDPLSEPYLLGTAAVVALWADELDEAELLVERGLAGQRPDVLHPMHEALLNTRMDIVAARADYATLLADPPPVSATPTNAHAHAVTALVETGRALEAEHLSDTFDLRTAPESWELNRFLYARGRLRAANGDPAGALHDFLECGRRESAREAFSPVVTPWRTAAAECHLALGVSRDALALAAEELRLARVWNTPRTVGRALRVLGTATGGRRGLELGQEAVRLLRDGPAGPELVAALLALGRQLTASGESSRARDILREAAVLAERHGAVRLRDLAEEALRVGGARRAATRTGAAALTDSERRIAELAAEGRTNTEIADLLHLARRTVETHLTHSYRKLGIRRRGALSAALSGSDTAGTSQVGDLEDAR
ncbi:LuxR C-terminal-related transcriptional regulator [Streptomyces sp. MUSC 125]|uniref:LuxR C-terminal-related transcriptional regulator n=1 Tax=Streptomyces sp. MUSC 125 TaxID=1428624 RepID=UPI000689D5EB|nr:AAA family ATPase [Streptomyces sp. MUSC 125]